MLNRRNEKAVVAVNVRIKCDNDAFASCPENEVARLLEEAARKIRRGGLDRLGCFALMDVNGNTVGSVEAEME